MVKHNPIQTLMDEHDVISSSVEEIQSIENLWEKNADEYKNKMSKLLEFFKEYGDKYHHYKEEEVLFPEMTNHPEFRQREIIAELEEHHNLFRDYVNEIEEALEEQEWEKVQNKLQQYLNDLLDHIAIENDEVFIMAESLFSEDELERIYFQFQDIDNEFGTIRKKELMDMLGSENN